jgi:hypothetical protein
MKGLKELLISLIDILGLACWVEISTDKPRCTYYFGPFLSKKEAEAAIAGYLEDLEQEGAQGIAYGIKRCKPDNLTIFDEVGEMAPRGSALVFSGQLNR